MLGFGLLSADGVSELLVHLLVLDGEKQTDFYSWRQKTAEPPRRRFKRSEIGKRF